TTKHIHLYDRISRAELPLPGINNDPNPQDPTLSNTGLLGFDHAGSDTTRVYDVNAQHFIQSGLVPFDNMSPQGHRDPHLSANGRYLATTCLSHCVADGGTD